MYDKLLKPRQSFWITLYINLHVKYSLFSSDFNETWIFSTYFPKILKISNFLASSRSRIVTCGWTDGQTDRHDESNSCFSQLCVYVTKTDSTSQFSSRHEAKTWSSVRKILKGSLIQRNRVCKGKMIRYYHTLCQWKRTHFPAAFLSSLSLSLPSLSLSGHTHTHTNTHLRNRFGFSVLYWMWKRTTYFSC